MVQHDFLLIMTTKPSKCNLNFKSNQQWKRTKKDLFETVKSEINYLAKNTDQKYLALCLEAEFFSISPKMEIKKWQLGNEELFALNDDDHTHNSTLMIQNQGQKVRNTLCPVIVWMMISYNLIIQFEVMSPHSQKT